MRHKHSKSVKVLPKILPSLQNESKKSIKNQSVLELPFISNRKTIDMMVSLLQENKSIEQKAKKEEHIVEIEKNEKQCVQRQNRKGYILKIVQKSKLLGQLKQKILQLNDNLFMKKVLSQIKYSSLGKIALQIWSRVQKFQNCDQSMLNRLEVKYQIRVGDDFIKSLNFINNICRFYLADYKKKMWHLKQKQISGHFEQIDQNMKKVGRRIQQIQNPQTKLQIVSSLAGMKQQCFAKKQRYLDWKQKAIQKLKQNQVHCQILRAQIFTQQFF